MAFDAHQPDQLSRYSRQLVLREIGPRGQKALGAGRVLVVGAGGLGSPALLYLAAAGVGAVTVIDEDAVELSNLQRQVLFTGADLDRPKAEAAAARLDGLNPHTAVTPVVGKLTPANAPALVAEADVVLDCSDNFPTRFLLADACRLAGKPLVQAGILHFAGQVTTYLSDRGPCYRCFFPQPPAQGLVPACREAGVLGAVGGVLGSLQAAEAVKLLTGAPERTLSGTLLMIDLWENQFERVTLPQDPLCPLCGDSPVITELLDDYEAAHAAF